MRHVNFRHKYKMFYIYNDVKLQFGFPHEFYQPEYSYVHCWRLYVPNGFYFNGEKKVLGYAIGKTDRTPQLYASKLNNESFKINGQKDNIEFLHALRHKSGTTAFDIRNTLYKKLFKYEITAHNYWKPSCRLFDINEKSTEIIDTFFQDYSPEEEKITKN